jgi:membrane protein YdbS with pleckstrin-like domain
MNQPTRLPAAAERRAAGRRAFWVACALLAVCLVGIGIYGWFSLRDSSMSLAAVIALILGVIATGALGIGLMSLLFYSNREGFDDEAGRRGTK